MTVAAAGGFTLVERLWGSADEGVWRAEPDALVSAGRIAELPDAELEAAWALPVEGVTPLLAVGRIDPDGRRAVVEALPDGAPAAARMGVRGACALGAQVAAVAARAHDAGLALGGIRPEAVWARDGALTALAPRAVRLWELRSGDLGIEHGEPELLRSPERLDGAGVSAADDVFCLAGTVATWISGHPFAGATRGERALGLLAGRRAPLAAPPALAMLLATGLGPAGARPPMRVFGATLARAG